MKHAEIESSLRSLLGRSHEHKWLRKLVGHPAAFELYAALANEVHINHAARGHSVMMTSALSGEGRTSIAILFAALAAATDRMRRVLLVDADFNRGALGRVFGLDAAHPGLSEYFDGTAAAELCVAPTAMENLHLVPVASGEPTRVLLSPKRFEEFMEFAGNRYDLIVVDAPAGSASKDVLSIARAVDQTVLVVRYGFSSRGQISTLAAELVRVNAKILGVVMNRREYVLPSFLYGN